ncbi:hypothetical protein B0H14DRAFT_2603717 [Mycena olivaceomarginata]|nr:hypothetical protein B0H14DRAFT_2603717 [Mycena olivaceomarginata]
MPSASSQTRILLLIYGVDGAGTRSPYILRRVSVARQYHQNPALWTTVYAAITMIIYRLQSAGTLPQEFGDSFANPAFPFWCVDQQYYTFLGLVAFVRVLRPAIRDRLECTTFLLFREFLNGDWPASATSAVRTVPGWMAAHMTELWSGGPGKVNLLLLHQWYESCVLLCNHASHYLL